MHMHQNTPLVDVSDLISKWEKHLNEHMVGNYRQILEKRDSLKALQAEYQNLKVMLDNIIELNLTSLSTQVNLGHQTYCSAHIEDTSKILVLAGTEIFIELTIPEALNFLIKKVALLQEYIESFSEPLARLRKDIIIAVEQLGKLQNI